jgi:hypothetical protein
MILNNDPFRALVYNSSSNVARTLAPMSVTPIREHPGVLHTSCKCFQRFLYFIKF